MDLVTVGKYSKRVWIDVEASVFHGTSDEFGW